MSSIVSEEECENICVSMMTFSYLFPLSITIAAERRSAGLGQKIETFSRKKIKLNLRRFNFPLISKAPTGLYMIFKKINE